VKGFVGTHMNSKELEPLKYLGVSKDSLEEFLFEAKI
jgi:hypothetical protein